MILDAGQTLICFIFDGVRGRSIAGVRNRSTVGAGGCFAGGVVTCVSTIPSFVGVNRLVRGFLPGVGVFPWNESYVSRFGLVLVRPGVLLVLILSANFGLV